MTHGIDGSETHKARRPWYQTLGGVLIILALVTVLQGAYFTYQQRSATQCLSEYNETLAAVQQRRADWAEEDRQALLTFLNAYDGDAPAAYRQATLKDLRDTYRRNGERRAATPLPELHECD